MTTLAGGAAARRPETVHTVLDSPIGALTLAGEGGRLAIIGFPSGKGAVAPAPSWRRDDGAFPEAREQLRAYFEGRLGRFDLDLDPRGTPFQREVWQALTLIPPGETISYGELARRIGRPSASRAVGAANGANPLPIVVPCHRVIGASGALTGFGGGVDAKRWLLAHERAPHERAPHERDDMRGDGPLFAERRQAAGVPLRDAQA